MPWQASLCGAVAGGFSAAVTTPLDVAKTRIMLAKVVTPLGLSWFLDQLCFSGGYLRSQSRNIRNDEVSIVINKVIWSNVSPGLFWLKRARLAYLRVFHRESPGFPSVRTFEHLDGIFLQVEPCFSEFTRKPSLCYPSQGEFYVDFLILTIIFRFFTAFLLGPDYEVVLFCWKRKS